MFGFPFFAIFANRLLSVPLARALYDRFLILRPLGPEETHLRL